jgi:hypothetical protein
MSGFLLHVGAYVICPHGGTVSAVTTNNRVFVTGQPVVTQPDTFTIAGCVFALPSGTPHPCVIAKWLVPATHVLTSGKPVILQNSVGICQSADQTPQGSPSAIITQVRVKGV